MTIDDLINRCNKQNTDNEWLQLQKDMIQFLKEDHPESEKRKLRPLGYLEMVTMICDGIKSD